MNLQKLLVPQRIQNGATLTAKVNGKFYTNLTKMTKTPGCVFISFKHLSLPFFTQRSCVYISNLPIPFVLFKKDITSVYVNTWNWIPQKGFTLYNTFMSIKGFCFILVFFSLCIWIKSFHLATLLRNFIPCTKMFVPIS